MVSFSTFLKTAAALACIAATGTRALKCEAGDTVCEMKKCEKKCEKKMTGYTIAKAEWDPWTEMKVEECGTTMRGCEGELSNLKDHDLMGTVYVKDDCTFVVKNWEFDGKGPALEWWASKKDGDSGVFPYPANAQYIAKLGEPGSYPVGPKHGGTQTTFVVRLGLDEAGNQMTLSKDLNHISVWCEEFAIDFGNAALKCPEEPKPECPECP